jgi:abortive infection bacteriophage resistance protein
MPRVPYTKSALSYADQLQQLKTRGLIVENDSKALHLLENISYYRLSGYWYPMIADPKTAHIFKPNSTFNNAFKLYCFDRELRKLILGELEKIEVAIRAKMMYELSHRHGSFWYTNAAHFTNPASHASTLSKITGEYNRSDEKFIAEFKRKYNDPMPPSWMMLELTSFGSLSMLYKNLSGTRDRRDIAHYFGLDDTTFESWLHSIVYVRNVCAHHSRLWSRVMRITPAIPASPRHTFLNHTIVYHPTTGQPTNNNRTYFLLSMIIYWLNIINPKHTFKNKLFKLLNSYPMIDVRAMGFPVNWETEPIWNWQQIVEDEKWYNRFLKTIRIRK